MMSPRMESLRSVSSTPDFRVQRRDLIGDTETFQLCRPADHQAPQLGGLVRPARAQVDDSGALIGGIAECAIEPGPAVSLDLLLQGGADFPLAAWTELQSDALRGPVAEPLADVVAADHKVLAVVGAPAHQHMNMRVARVPVIEGDPVELRAEITLDVRHQCTGISPKIVHLRGVLGRNDEAEMMPVISAALGKSPLVGGVRLGTEPPGVGPVTGYALAL